MLKAGYIVSFFLSFVFLLFVLAVPTYAAGADGCQEIYGGGRICPGVGGGPPPPQPTPQVFKAPPPAVTPPTGPETFGFAALIPTGLVGLFLRRKSR